MRIKLSAIAFAVLVATAIILPAAISVGTELSMPEIQGRAGQTFRIPLMIDAVDNLAGVKIVIQYDKDLLTYRGSKRTSQTASLMHIVNDNKPGILIIVMAGARGIKGRQFSIFSIRFEVTKELEKETLTKFKIAKSQLMSDQLKDIKHTVKISQVRLKP